VSGKDRPRFWLMKTEPEVFSFDDLLKAPGKMTCWEGVRNYQARNMMRDEFKIGDQVIVYHSNANPPGVAGFATVVREAYPDPAALDPRSDYFDEKSKADGKSRWVMVDIQASSPAKRLVSLDEIRKTPGLEAMLLLRKGQRLSIQPVTASEWKILAGLAGVKV
jgi:predicted RNA-binding protein with PUA-like domain